jgi:hypothetical protein
LATPARLSLAAVIACAGLGAACGSLDDHRQVTLQLSTVSACVRTSLACGGELGVVVADGKTDEVLDERCVPLGADAGVTLEKLPAILAALEPPLRPLASGRSIVVEVTAYSPATGKSCPRYSATVANNPAVPSYFGRSSATTAGATTSIAVSLQCFPSTCIPCTKFAAPGPLPAEPLDGAVAEGGATDGAARDGASSDGAAPDAGATDGGAATDAGAVGDGSAGAPYRSIGKLLSSLGAGQTGCLTEGTYVEDVTFPKGGSGANPITLAAAPGARVVVKGVLTVPDTADNVAIVNLVLDGATAAKSAGPLVRGDHVAFRGNDITNAGADCLTLGDPMFGVAKIAVIDANRIHGCKTGVAGRLAESSVVAHNFIFDNTADGVAFFPSGDGFTVEHNVIDGNASGVLFGSDGKLVSINDTVRQNVISNSTKGFDVYSAYPAAVGTGNTATQNCLWMGAKGEVMTPMKGFSVKDNVTADPMFVDRTGKDFRLAAGSPCQGFGPLR